MNKVWDWIKEHWTWIVAALAGLVVFWLFIRRNQSTQNVAVQPSFIPASFGGGGGGTEPAPQQDNLQNTLDDLKNQIQTSMQNFRNQIEENQRRLQEEIDQINRAKNEQPEPSNSLREQVRQAIAQNPFGLGAAQPGSAREAENERRIREDSAFRQFEIARTRQVIQNRKAASLDVSLQEKYLNRLLQLENQ